MDIFDISLWAGTEGALANYMLALNKLAEEGVKVADYGDSEDKPTSRLLTKQGGVGIITIAGSLNNSNESWYNRYMGTTGYPEIRRALILAAQDPEIEAILLDVKSGGGAVSGVADTSNLIRIVDSKVKPVYTYAENTMASAAYWLGASARKVYAGSTAEVGSIGVLMVHQDLSKLYEKMGVTTTVIRSGKFKAMGHPMEPLSEEARDEMQKQIDALAKLFTEHVAERRGVTYAVANDKMGQGRMFLGDSAKAVGLVDDLTTFDALVDKLTKGIDAKKQTPKYGANFSGNPMKKNALTEAEIAALALTGGASADAGGTAPEADAAGEGAGAADADPAAPAAPAAAAPAAAAPAADDKFKAQVDLLTGQLAAAQASVVDLTVQLRAASASGEKLKADVDKLLPIARGVVGNLRVALGQTREGVDALGLDSVVEAHADLSAQFNKKFKAGGVAASSQDTGPKADVANSALKQARLRATSPGK